MNKNHLSRRQFIERTGAAAGALLFSSCSIMPPRKRTAVDQVSLGNTGIKLSRLGMGCGSNSGEIQRALGKDNFVSLVHYAYDQGITYFDCAQSYRTFDWMGDALKGLPREKLFIQSKIPGKPENILTAIDKHRSMYQTDYFDSMLIHCMVTGNWTDDFKRIMDGFDEAKSKKWIRAKGVSCHSLPALRAATASNWTEVHLVRVNPQAKYIDGETQAWNQSGNDISPVMAEIKSQHAKGRGIIGMKLVGNGDFKDPEDREKAIRFAMAQPEINAVVIGFKARNEVDEAIQRINAALAA